MRLELEPDLDTLNEFRLALDDTRLTAWSVSELVNAHLGSTNREAVLAFVSAERLRRFRQILHSLTTDITRGALKVRKIDTATLLESIQALEQALANQEGR